MRAAWMRIGRAFLVAGALLTLTGAQVANVAAPATPLAGYGADAAALRTYTAARLAYYGGAPDCATAPYVSYRRSDADPGVVDAWYVALQVSADADLVRLGLPEYGCTMDKALTYLELLWNPDGGGYAPRAGPDGSNPSPVEMFADDNALIGISYLDAAAATPDPVDRDRYLALAVRVATYLTEVHWDDSFGGGLWWSTRRAAAREGKPAQANALAAALFLRLASLSDASWGAWADRTLGWLDATLWDEDAGLYRWAVHYAEQSSQAGRLVSPYYFNYDQGLMIEALLLQHQAGERGSAALARAERIAAALDDTFWDDRRPGYSLRSGVVWIYPVFAAWLTPPLLQLYAADADPRWLEMASRNVEALAASMRDADGGYFDYAWDCTRWTTRRERCPESGWVIGGARSSGAQASVQRALASLALAAPPSHLALAP
jgi:Glycosyl hydrolase family 76